MKKEVKQLRKKAINGLTLCIDHFNRPWDQGREEAVLILLDHAFEMLLKAAIRHRGGKIRKPRDRQTIGFEACVRKSLTEPRISFLSKEQALTLQAINRNRDDAHHYLIDLSEHQLYFYTQAGVTLFRDIHDYVFDEMVLEDLPERVLPVSTTAPRDLVAVFDTEVENIKALLAPGTRKKMDAVAKARSLAVLDGAINGDYDQPSDNALRQVCDRLAGGEEWTDVFPGVASINISAEGEGHAVQLRLSKKEGIPVRLVKEGEGGGTVVAVKRVNELDFYSIGLRTLKEHLGVNQYNARALVWYFDIQNHEEYFKEITVGRQRHKRYSRQALERLREELPNIDINEVRRAYRERHR